MVECVRLETHVFELADVVGGLADPPSRCYARHDSAPQPAGDPDATLAGLVRVAREASVGSRNEKLNWAAFRAGEHIAAGVLSPGDAEAELLAAALDAGLGEAEAMQERTAEYGEMAGDLSRVWVAEKRAVDKQQRTQVLLSEVPAGDL